MAKINLLPWREEARKKKQQDFVASVFAGVLFTAFILLLVYMYIEGLKNHQSQRNAMIKNEIVFLDKKIAEIREIEDKKNKLLKKIEVIQDLQESRPEIVRLFDELARTTPEGVHLTKFAQVGQTLTIDGKAESNARVSAFMRAIEHSDWLSTPVLGVIKGQGKSDEQMNDFSLTATQSRRVNASTAGGKQ